MTAVASSEYLRHQMAAQLVADSALCSPQWIDAFRSVPREAFVTRFEVGPPSQRTAYDVGSDEDKALRAVYTNTTLITQHDDGGTATSSSTEPSLMAIMLETLDAQPGHRVLEIGTGTGYNAALLCHALGDGAVSSIDIDPQLVERARTALAGLGYHPHLTVGDGAHVGGGGFDRIIATCGFLRVPAEWLSLVPPGGVILVNLGFGLVRLVVTEDGTATGPVTGYAAFMQRRPTFDHVAMTGRDVVEVASGEGVAVIGEWPEIPDERAFDCLHSLVHPTVDRVTRRGGDDVTVMLADHLGQWSRARRTGDNTAAVVFDGHNLWNDYTELARSWQSHGCPAPMEYGITVRPDGTHLLWLRDPVNVVSTLH